ncbi:hypothetical protein Mapa_016564 [Marchantia paleacea]|nr:hypothetical protein Mapa_016564 [Marchantia paleacea]
MFTLMFLSFYALLGIQLFGGSFHFRCERKSDREASFPERACVNYYKAISDPQGEYVGWTDTCNKSPFAAMVCKERSNPNWGATNFDNFAASILIVFQVLTFEGWSLIMRWANDSSALKSTQTYFVILVIFGSYFLVNVFVATISGVFLRVRKEHQVLMRRYRRDKAFSFANALQMASLIKEVILSNDARLTWRHRLRRKTRGLSTNFSYALNRQSTRLKRTMSRAVDWKDSSSYLKHISSFAFLGTDDFADILPDDPTLPRSLSRSLSRIVSCAARLGRSVARSVSMTTHQYVLRISAKCWMIVHSKVFKYAVLLFVSFNMIVLCSVKANMTSRHADAVRILMTATN